MNIHRKYAVTVETLLSRVIRGKIFGITSAALFSLMVMQSGYAQHSSTGSWNLNSNGNWSTTANWSGLDAATDYPSGIDAIANLNNNISANLTITLDVAVTLGILNIGDSSGGQSFTLSGGTLTFDSLSGFSQLNKTNGGGSDTISSTIVLNNQLDITVDDTDNNQGLTLSGIISGGTAGTVTMTFNDLSIGNTVNWLILNNANTFSGQLVANSGLIRLEGNNGAAGVRGVGNETIAQNGGSIDLRDRDFNIGGVDDTEIFIISGMGTNGLGALRNTAGNANLSHLVLAGDSAVGGYSRFDLIRHTDSGGVNEIAPILDFDGNFLSKFGSSEFVIRNGDFLNKAGGGFNVYEGELRFENNGALAGGALIGGTTYGNDLSGLVINIAYNRNAYDGADPANGTRTSDPFSVNAALNPLSGNSLSDARISFGTYWGSHAANTKVVETYDNFTVNLNNGAWQREGSTGTGQTFDQIFGSGVVVNFVGGGIGRDANGSGNIFDIQGGAGGYNGTTLVYDHPGITEFGGTLDNTSVGNAGTGFTVRGNRQLSLTGDSSATFNGDILVKGNTGRQMAPNYSTGNGAAESQYFNLSLAGANGSLAGANSITITRWSSLALLNNTAGLYPSTNNDDRLNDAGITSLRNGYLILETDVAAANHENFGNVVADFGTNYLYLDTRAGGQFDGAFQTFTRNNNGVLKIMDLNGSHTFGSGLTDDRIALIDSTGLVLVGANAPGTATQRVALGLFGGTLPTAFSTSTNRSNVTMQNAYAFGGAGLGLMTLDAGYLRPLTSSEYNISGAPLTDTNWLVDRYIVGGNASDRANYALRNVSVDTTVNSLTIGFNAISSGQALPTSPKDYVIIEAGKTLTISSGIINFASYAEATSANLEAVIRGGFVSMDGGNAIINSGLTWHDSDRSDGNWYNFISGNSAFIRSHLIDTVDLTKSGRNNLYLETWNDITGNIYLSEQNGIIARHAGALGLGAVGREVLVGGAAYLGLEYGTNISGINLRVSNTFQGSSTVLRGEGAYHNTWGGDVILDVADDAGSSDFQSYTITARNNGTLTLNGNVYTANNANFTDSDSFSDPPVVTTSIGESYTLNLMGQFRDVATGNLGTDPANSLITSIFRTGDSTTRLDANHSLRFQMTGHDEGNVNVFQQWDATGRLDMNRGYFRIMYDPGAALGSGGFLTDGADALIQGNDYWTRAALGADGAGTGTYHSHLMLTEANQVFNWANILYVYNNNRDGTLSIGGEHESGQAYIGNTDGANYQIIYENQGGDRDLRFTQVRGGELVINARLFDNGTSVNSIATVSGPGTVIFNANAAGQSTVERWNFMGGEAVWQANPGTGSMIGNDRFAVSTAQALFGGGDLTVLAEATTNRNLNLTGNVRVLNGESTIRLQTPTGRTTNLNFGAGAAVLDKRAGGTLAFIEEGAGTSNITMQATGLTNTGIMSWAVYGTSTGTITDFASNGASGAISAYAGYTAGATEADYTGANDVDVTGDVSFTAPAAANTLRFDVPVALTLDGQSMTLTSGAILITSANAGSNSITGGSLTSGFDANLGTAGTSRDLMIHNYGTDSLTIGAVITDNGADKVNLVVGGTGTTILTGTNTNTGETYLNGGVLSISSEDNLGAIDGSISRLARVNNGSNTGASGALYFLTNGVDGGATGTFTASNNALTGTSLTSGGSGYTSGVYVNTHADTSGNAGVWAILDSGNLHFDGGTLAVTENVTLDGARTIFLGANGGTMDVVAGKTLTINGYITSEWSHINSTNGYTANHLGGSDEQASNRNPDIGDLIVEGGGTVVLTGAPDNVIRSNMYNSYGGITWINNGTLKIASAGSSSSAILGAHRSWIDGTVIGANGTLELNSTSDPTIYEWLTFRGKGYEGRGTIISTGTARTIRLRGQMFVESDMLFNNTNSSNFLIGEGGGALYGTGNIARTGNGEFSFYTNAPDWTGSYLSGSGNTRLYGSTNLQGMTSMSLDRNSYLGYGAGSTSVDEFRDRLNDNLAISTNGYTKMRLEAGAGIFSGVEKVGTVTVNGGVFGIEYDLGTDITSGAPRNQGDYAGWHFTDIVRTPGSVVQVRNFDPGTDISGGVTDLANRALVLVDSGASVLGTLVGGDGTNLNDKILPGFFGGTRPDTFLNTTTGVIWDEDRTSRFLMTAVAGVDPITGAPVSYLRPLEESDYKIISDPGTIAGSTTVDLATAGINADQNVRFVGLTDDVIGNGLTSRVNSVLTLGATSDQTLHVNSLTFATDATASNVNNAGNQVNLVMGQGGKLVIDSGVLMFANMGTMDKLGNASNIDTNLDINNYLTGGTLDFNGQEAIIYAGSEWAQYNISGNTAYNNTDTSNTSVIFRTNITNTGGNGLTKTGASSVFFEGRNSYSGATYVNMGLLYARNDYAFGQSTILNVTGGGGVVLGNNSRIFGVDLNVGPLNGNNLVLYAETEGAQWGGNVIIDNVDAAGRAGGFTRNFVPRIEVANSNAVFFIDGDIYGGDTAVVPGLQGNSRIFSTYTDATSSVLELRGQIKDKSTGAIGAPVTAANQNDVLRMEITGGNDLVTVHTYQPYDSAGRIQLVRGVLRYMGDGDFYTAAAAAAINPDNEMSGLQMGGRSLFSSAGTGAADVALFLNKAGSTFNLSSWSVGVDTADASNSLGNGNYGLGNTTGNTIIGGENTSGTITFGTGTGSIRFTQATTLYDRDLTLYAARGGTVDMKVNFLDGGDFVNSSITKVGAGTMNLLGSSAGDSTVEALKMLGGTLNLTGYDVNANRRVGNGAALTLSGGYLIVDATAGTAQEDFGDLTLNSGGSRLAAIGNATVNIVSSNTLVPEDGVSLAFIENSGGVINLTASGLTTTDGERFGNWAIYGNALGQVTDWAAREGTTGVKAFTGYTNDTFSSGLNTNVTTNATFGSNTATLSVKFGSAANLDLGGNTLTVENGGMLVSAAAGGPVNITNGTLNRIGAGDITLHNYGGSATTISANIVDNGGKANFVTGGVGTTVLTGNNTYTGETYINGGVLEISSESQLGDINGSIVRLVRENNGSNGSGGVLTFSTTIAPTVAATGTYTGTTSVSATNLTSGGSGYTTGIHVNARPDNTSNAGIWAILDSGNIHIDGGTLSVKDDITLDGARTIFLGASSGTFDIAAGKTLTVNGYITSGVSDLPNDDLPFELSNPLIGGLSVEGGGTLTLTGAPDNTARENMYNGYNALTSINNGTIKIAGLASSASNALGTYGGWADSTYIGSNGTLQLTVTNADVGFYEWLTLDGQGYQGGGTVVANGGTGTVRAYYLRGQINVVQDAVFNLRNGSNIYAGSGGGDIFGGGDIIKIGNGDFRFYGNNPYWTGAYVAASGTSRLYDGGHVQGMASMTLERNSYFGYDGNSNSADELRDRFRDDMSVFTDGYVRMRMEATGGVYSSVEKLGVVTVLNGQLGLEFDLGSTLTGGAANLTGDYAGWHFTEIVRNPGTVVNIRNFDYGTTFADSTFDANTPAAANANVAVLQVDVLPTLIGTGDGTNGNAKVAAGFFAGTRPDWINVAGTGQIFNDDYTANRLVTADTNLAGDTFLRPLKDSEYKVVSNPDTAQTTMIALENQGITADQNLKIVGVVTDTGIGAGELNNRRNSILTLGSAAADCAMPDGMTINSLTFASESFADGANGRGNWTSLMLGDGGKLTINSGMIMVYNTGVQNRNGASYDANQNLDIRSSLTGGSVDFNANEAIFNIGSIWAFYNTSDAVNAYRATDFDNNYFYMNSSIVNATNLVKTGGSGMRLSAPNFYTGDTYINYGAIYAWHDDSLGLGTKVDISGYGTLVTGNGARITGKDLYVGKIADNRTALQIENSSVWAGNVIIDNVDSGGATAYARSFVPRIFNNTTGLGTIEGNIYGGSTPIGSGALTESRMFSTYTGAWGLLQIAGQVRDTASGAITGPIDIYNQSQVLRMEVTANNNESAVQLDQQYDAAGRINLIRGGLYYAGTGDFYTAAAAATVNSAPLNPMLGLQMGGRSVTSDSGLGAANLSFFLLNGGSNFNLKSWQVGVDTNDADNLAGNYTYGRGNTTGNSTIGGVNISGNVNFGTGDGSIYFTQATTLYDRDLGLFAARGGQATFNVNFVDGGSFVNSSITKLGAGTVNLKGSSAGDSTVERVNVMGGILNLTDYGTNTNRRVGNGASLTLAGGTVVMDGSGASFTENFSSLTLNQGGNGIAAAGNGGGNVGTVSIAGTSITRAAGSSVHFQSILSGVVSFSNAAMQNVARIGSYATFGTNASSTPFATDWAATDVSGNVVAFTGYGVDSFGAATHTDVQGAGLAAATTESVRFNNAAGTITSGTLTLNDGGMLFTSNFTTGTPVGSGVTVTTAAVGTDLMIHNYASGTVNFDGKITGAQNVVFTGTGELALVSPSGVSGPAPISSTTTSNSYNVTMADTTGLTAGMDVTGVNIPAGTKILSITDGTTIVVSKLPTAAGTNSYTYSTTTYTPNSDYTGATHVTGAATVSFNNIGAFGSTSGFLLNGGTLNYSETGAISDALTTNITLGGGNGTLSVADAGSTLIIRGSTINQISSEANNIITSYGTNNPNAGGLNIIGSGTVQFGDRSAASNADDYLGIQNNYTGLTILGDGTNALRVDLQGQANDNNHNATVFGTTESWADATIVRNNVTLEFSPKRGDGNHDGQFRLREWFQIGETGTDEIVFDGSTQRQPTLDGIINVIGNLTFQTQGNRYGDAGSTGNSEFLINPNEGGLFGAGNITKLGDGNLRFYNPLHEWTGDLDLQDGFTAFHVNSGAIFNPNGVVYLGDPTATENSLVRVRVENRYFGNNTTALESANFDLSFNRDIIVRDNLKQEVRIEAGYLPRSSMIHYQNINVGSGSTSYVRLYYEDNNNLDASLVGSVQHVVFDIAGNITGSNTVYVDGNNSGGTSGNGAKFTVLMNGDNSAYTGQLSIGIDQAAIRNPGRDSYLRIGTANANENVALGTNTNLGFRNGGVLQLGGNSMTFARDFLFTGGVGNATTAGVENASGTAATITFDSGSQANPTFQDIGVGLRDGLTPSYFGSESAALTVVKTGIGETVFGAATGGGAVADSFSNYTGNTLVQQGKLIAGSNNSFSPNSRFIVSNGATLSPNWIQASTGYDVSIGSLAGAAGATVDVGNSAILRIGGDHTTDADFAGAITGDGSVYKFGYGAQTLSGVNDFVGNVAVVQGALIGASNTAFGDGSNQISLGGVTFDGGTPIDSRVELLLNGSANAVTNAVSMNAFDGNDEGITVIGTRATSGTYGFAAGGTVSLYQDYSTNVFFEAQGASIFQFGDSVTNGGFSAVTNVIKTGAGNVELRAANSYGIAGAAGAAIDGGTVLRHGTLSIFDSGALSSTVVELGDIHQALATDVALATNGSLLATKVGGSFDPTGDGAGGAGNGAFLNVKAEVDGTAILTTDVGKRILVKDEGNDPERNGVYVVVSVDAACNQMNLVRASDFDSAGEMLYGTSVGVTGGSQAGNRFFMASTNVGLLNGDGADPVYWSADIANPNIELLAGTSGLYVANAIDINSTNGTGTTTIGGTFTTGTTEFNGDVTLQSGLREVILTSASSDSGGGVIFSGAISEAGGATLSIDKQGNGIVTFAGANTFTGTTTLSEGTLVLDYTTSSDTSKLSDTAALVLGTGTLQLDLDGGGGTHFEEVASTTLTGMANVTRGAFSGVELWMNDITRNAGATINFSESYIARTDTLNTNGILGGWATIGGTDFAMNEFDTADGYIVAYTSYTDVTRLASGTKVITNAAASNVRIIEGTGGAAPITLGAAVTSINSLNQSTEGGSSAATIDFGGTNTLAVNNILVGTGAGDLNLGTAANDGTLIAGTSGGDLMVQNYSASALNIKTVIADNTTASSFSVGGTGNTILTGTNTYTGATNIISGNLQVGAAGVGQSGSGATLVNGANAILSGTGLVRGATTVSIGTLRPGDHVGGVAGAGTGTLTFSNGLTYAGGTTELQISGALSTESDRINVSGGTLTLSNASNIVVAFDGFTPTQGMNYSWNLFDWATLSNPSGFSVGTDGRTGGLGGGNLDLADISSIIDSTWDVSQFLSSGVISIVSVPEPSRVILLFFGTLAMLWNRKRKQ